MAEIVIKNMMKTYPGGKRPAVNDVDLTISDGEFMVLLGPSGCGKTTLLRLVAGLEYPDGGSISIGNADVTDVPPRKREMAMVFQSYAIFPHMTVHKNISFGLRMRHEDRKTIDARVRHAAELVQLSEFLDRYPAQLSGGQRQRVAVARAIVMEPAVLLMDEPLSNLDALLRLQFRAELKKLVQDLNTTTIYVTHDQIEALSLGSRIAVMRDGQILQCDLPMRVYDGPATTFVGGFIGNPPMNFLRGRVQTKNSRVEIALGEVFLDGPADLSSLDGQDVLVGIRAENIDVWTEHVDGALPAEIQVIEPLGADLLLSLTVANQSLKLMTRNDFPAKPGLDISIRPQIGKICWYNADGSRIQTATEPALAGAPAG